MGAFSEGFKAGGDMYDSSERIRLAKEELAMRKAEADRAAEKFGWERDAQTRAKELEQLNDADLRLLTNPNAGNYSIADQSGGLGLKYKPQQVSAPETDLGTESYGLQAPVAPKLAAPKGGYTANDIPEGADAEAILGRVALRKGDLEGYRKSQDRAKAFNAEKELRGYIDELQGLYKAATMPDATPEAKEAWTKAASPHMQMISGFKDMAFDARVNPTTGRMEIIPYDGGPVRPVSFEEAAPYLIASRQLTSKYGDPGKALEALHAMSEKEKSNVMDMTKFRVGLKEASAKSIAEVFKNTTDKDYKAGLLKNDNARLGLTRERALMERMGQGQYFKNEKGETVFGIPVMTKKGLTYQQVDLGGLTPILKGKPSTPHEVKPEGTIMDDGNGGRYKVGKNGESHDVFAPAIDDRPKVFEAAGIPKTVNDEVEWGEDGRSIRFNYNYYDSHDPKSMAKLKADYLAYGRNQALGAEESAARRDQMDPSLYRAGLYRSDTPTSIASRQPAIYQVMSGRN